MFKVKLYQSDSAVEVGRYEERNASWFKTDDGWQLNLSNADGVNNASCLKFGKSSPRENVRIKSYNGWIELPSFTEQEG